MSEKLHIDLFSGIGGFALAARANAVRTVLFCEIDKRCRDFLGRAWPGVRVHDDIRSLSLADAEGAWWRKQQQGERKEERTAFARSGGIYLLTAGVPCQPASRAGKQRGASDDRWLWPEALRVLSEVRPTWALFENPPGIGDVGLAGILADLEAQAYQVSVVGIPACAVNAPHQRMRYWIICRSVADNSCSGHAQRIMPGGVPSEEGCTGSRKNSGMGGEECYDRRVADDDQARSRGADSEPGAHGLCAEHRQGDMADYREERGRRGEIDASKGGRAIVCDDHAGELADGWENYVWLPCTDGKFRRAPDDSVGLVDGLHRSVLGALGNSIVPQVAERIVAAMIKADEG